MARCGLDSHRALEVCVFGIGEGELAIIVVFGFLLFGPDKLPQMGRTPTSSYLRFHQSEVCAVLYDISMFLLLP